MDTNDIQMVDNILPKLEEKYSKNVPKLEEKNSKMSAQVSIGKISIDKIIKEESVKEESGQGLSETHTPKTTRFIPPKQEEVEAYIKDNGYHVNAERFCLFYESKGWMVGKNKMKDWKACVRTWEQKWKEEHPAQEPTGNHSFDADEFFNMAVAKQRSNG